MAIPSDILNDLLSLPANERFILAQQLLDSIDPSEAARHDEQLERELQRRREQKLRGEEIVSDWRAALSGIERSMSERS